MTDRVFVLKTEIILKRNETTVVNLALTINRSRFDDRNPVQKG